MPTFLNGLPFHVFIVHAVVVLVPLAALGTITIAVWPAARRRYGWLVVGVTLAATASVPMATDSGEHLRDHLQASPQIHTHAQLGDQLLILVVPLLLVAAGLMGFDLYRRRRPAGDTARWYRAAGVALSAVTVIFAVLAGIQVVRIGDSGARAAWGDTQYTSQPAGAGKDGG
jgi:hypothetical protein